MGTNKGTIFDKSKDIPASQLRGFVRLLFSNIRQDVLNRPKLSQKERSLFEAEAKTFTLNLRSLLANKDKPQREAALRAIWSALSFGYYHRGGRQILREIQREFQKERTKPAISARRQGDIQKFINQHARDLWKLKPSFKGNKLGTAQNIFNGVLADICRLPKVPTGWEIPGPNDLKAEKRYIDKIRKRVPPA